jgi:multiple sugar transport system substrate-binding protein/putative aldouronate transport system substrate-binding protein
MVMMVKSTAALYGWEEFGFGLYNVMTQEFQGALQEGGEYLRALRFYNQLNQAGLFDPDSMTQRFDDATLKYRSGISFFNIFTFVAEQFNSDENMEAGRALMCIPAADQKNLVNGMNVFGMNRVWTIGANSNHPELAMEIINWLSTPEGRLTYEYGPQGVTWDYDESGDTFLTELGLAAQNNKRTTIIEYGNSVGSYRDGEFQHNNTTWNLDTINVDSASGETFNWDFWESTRVSLHVFDIEQSWREWAGGVETADEFLRNEDKVAISLGTPFVMAARDTEINVIWGKVKNEIVNGSWDAIYAKTDEEFDKIVSDMISNAVSFGYDECIEWLESEAKRRKEIEDIVREDLLD